MVLGSMVRGGGASHDWMGGWSTGIKGSEVAAAGVVASGWGVAVAVGVAEDEQAPSARRSKTRRERRRSRCVFKIFSRGAKGKE